MKLILSFLGFLFGFLFLNTDTGGAAGTSEGDGKNSAAPTGGQPAAPSGDGKADVKADDPRFTQADIDRIVKARLAEEEKRASSKAEADRKRAEEDALAKNAEWQKLADARGAELESLKPMAERAGILATRMNALVDTEIASWPDEVKGFDPGADNIEARLVWLEKARPLAAKLSTPQRPPQTQLGQKPPTPGSPPEKNGNTPTPPTSGYRFQQPNDVSW